MEPFRRFLCSGLAPRRVLRCQQFNIVPPFAKPAHGKQRLALPAAPFALQVHIQLLWRFHIASASLSLDEFSKFLEFQPRAARDHSRDDPAARSVEEA